MNSQTKSLNIFLERNPKLIEVVRGLPDLGSRLDGNEFSKEVKKIYNSFSIYGNRLYSISKKDSPEVKTKSLGGGSPMKTEPFPLCKQRLFEAISDDFSEYPLAAGDENARSEVAEYLIKEGFSSFDEVDKKNIIFTVSTTQAFSIIMKVIARPYDVILMTGPNYGLFTFIPERAANATVEIIDLSLEDDWYINPSKLSNRIDEINFKLEKKYKNKFDYTPRVVAFLNENPHNPLGKVLSEKNKNILIELGKVCLEKGVFVIDDIIYRDLTFDRDNLAKPMATIKEYFDNTITIMGLSKSYGLASLRSGMVVANAAIIRAIRNEIFQTMDSSPVLQAKAIAGAFNASKERYFEYEKYFNPIINEYEYRLQLLIAMVEGIEVIDNYSIRSKIVEDIVKNLDYEYSLKEIIEGIPNVNLVKKAIPESGFFVLIDYTGIKGKKANNKLIIKNEIDLLKFMYKEERLKIIIGQSISWPNKNELIGRLTTALTRKEIINYIASMNRCLRKLR